jgi:hypothetical protein
VDKNQLKKKPDEDEIMMVTERCRMRGDEAARVRA